MSKHSPTIEAPDAPPPLPEPTSIEAALAERPETTKPPLPPARPLSKMLERIEQVDFTEHGYPGLTVGLWVSPPERAVNQWLEAQVTTGDLLLQTIRTWSLTDDDGQLIAITADHIAELPSDVIGILSDAFWMARQAPLVATRKARSEALSPASPPAPVVPDLSDMTGPSSSPNGSTGG